MTKKTQITPLGIFLRYLLAAVVVFATYNPTGYSWVNWARIEWVSEDRTLALLAFTAVVLLIGWAICLRATVRSLGVIGTVLALAFFGILLWLLIDYDIVGVHQPVALTWLVDSHDIEVDNIPAGTYDVYVGETVEGEFIVECEGEGEGQECWGGIDWHDPAVGEELFLNFDPRGKTIAIKQGIDVYLITSFPFD